MNAVRSKTLRGVALIGVLALAAWWTARRAPDRPPAREPPSAASRTLDMPVVRLRGDARAKGLEHGRRLRPAIHEWIRRTLPADPGSRDFLMKTAGARMGPLFPPHLREELAGIAEGAGVAFDELLYLNTRFELEAHDLGVPGPSYAEAGVAALDGVRRGFPADHVDGLVFFVHESDNGPLAILALPGMVGGFLGFDASRAVVGTADDTSPVLKALPWPVVVRLVLERRLAPGDAPPGPISRPIAIAIADRDGPGGVWNYSPPDDAAWYPGDGGPLATSFVSARAKQDTGALFRLDARAVGDRPAIQLKWSGPNISGRCGRTNVTLLLAGPG